MLAGARSAAAWSQPPPLPSSPSSSPAASEPSVASGSTSAYPPPTTRRVFTSAVAAAPFLTGATAARAEGGGSSLASRLASRKPEGLKRNFNPNGGISFLAPGAQQYPPWFEGVWDTEIAFRGFEFPTLPQLPKEQLVADVQAPGFQVRHPKLLISMLVDAGRTVSHLVSPPVPSPPRPHHPPKHPRRNCQSRCWSMWAGQ